METPPASAPPPPRHWLDVRSRVRLPELMDDPSLAADLHRTALDGLARLNAISRSVAVVWGPIRELAEQLRRPIRVLDVATGGGDVPIGLALAAKRAQLKVAVAGCDVSPCALEYAAERAQQTGVAAEWFTHDALADALPGGYDVVTCTLFLHHLERDDVVRLLTKMQAAAGSLVVINDLERSALGLVLVYLGSRIFSRSPIVHVDGPRSVRAAFTREELHAMATEAGMAQAQWTRHFPGRMQLVWRRDAPAL